MIGADGPAPVGPAGVPAWLKWLVGAMGASLAAGAPTAATFYLDARKQTQQAEAVLADQSAKAEALRFEAFAKATRANDLSDELRQCQTTVDHLVERLGVQ